MRESARVGKREWEGRRERERERREREGKRVSE